MNILYLHTHDAGRYIQPYGHAIPTPHLQQLAEEGVMFRQAFCAAPTCSPSRAALLTGQYPHQCGMLGLAHLGHRLQDYHHHLIHPLKKTGYHTALSGIQHIANAPASCTNEIGYDEVLTESHDANDVSAQTAKFLNRDHTKPFFLSVGLFPPHQPFPSPHPPADKRYCTPPAPLPDTPETRDDMARYISSMRFADDAIGTILNTLKETGLDQKTLIIATTDHGIPLPSMKCNLTDHGTGVYLILKGPGELSGGQIIDSMVSHLDIYPTVCELLKLDPPKWLEGKSLLPLINGEAHEIHDEIFSEITFHAAYEPVRAVRTKRWKYIRRFGDRHQVTYPNTDNSAAKVFWHEQGWRDQQLDEESLFDLVFDPNEINNLANTNEHQEPLQEMRDRLDKWMKKTNDPLLNGPVPLPENGITTDPDAWSPLGSKNEKPTAE